jgi:hypothetical protein
MSNRKLRQRSGRIVDPTPNLLTALDAHLSMTRDEHDCDDRNERYTVDDKANDREDGGSSRYPLATDRSTG